MKPLWLAILCAALVIGCGDDSGRIGVSGKVRVDGEPLAAGSILFEPMEETKSPSSGTDIKDGIFNIPRDKGPMPGKFRVAIHSQRPTGKQIAAHSPAPPGTLVDEIGEAIPEHYNARSTLIVEIRSGKPLDFDIHGK